MSKLQNNSKADLNPALSIESGILLASYNAHRFRMSRVLCLCDVYNGVSVG